MKKNILLLSLICLPNLTFSADSKEEIGSPKELERRLSTLSAFSEGNDTEVEIAKEKISDKFAMRTLKLRFINLSKIVPRGCFGHGNQKDIDARKELLRCIGLGRDIRKEHYALVLNPKVMAYGKDQTILDYARACNNQDAIATITGLLNKTIRLSEV